MPSAGEEGYETIVCCPYDRAHEIRLGRLQFHLDKCRKNFPNAELTNCPFNNSHVIPKVEVEFHTKEVCESRSTWDVYAYSVGNVTCPVQDLVPVNAATVPDGDENWDNYEAQGSVLNNIRSDAAERPIIRSMQCESRAKRRNFRKMEAERHREFEERSSNHDAGAASVSNREPLPRPTRMPNFQVERQDPNLAMANICRQFRTLDMGIKTLKNENAPSETSSMCNAPPSVARTPTVSEYASTSYEPFNYGEASSSTRPSTAMSVALSTSTRTSTAMSIEASARRMAGNGIRSTRTAPDEEGFSQIPIPGLGRGAAARRKPKK